MVVLISDNACTVTSQKVRDILCMYHTKSHTSEPHHQHTNNAKCCIGHIKDVMNCVLTFTGVPNSLWLLCLIYVVYILNITANNSIDDIPLTSIYTVKLPMFLLHFVSISMNQSTTEIPMLEAPKSLF